MISYETCVRVCGDSVIPDLKALGWGGACILHGDSNKGDTKILESNDEFILLNGVLLSGDVKKSGRTALKKFDLVYVTGPDLRDYVESWDVDVVLDPHKGSDRDPLYQRDSGIDHVMAKFMAERNMFLALSLDTVISSEGLQRAQAIAKNRQNVRLARKYGVKILLSSGAISSETLRTPLDLMSLGWLFGLTLKESREALSENTGRLIQKSIDRSNPDVITKGLKVVSWGNQTPLNDKMTGWY